MIKQQVNDYDYDYDNRINRHLAKIKECVSQKLNLLGNGEFDVIIDKSSNKHEISNMILDQILDELDS